MRALRLLFAVLAAGLLTIRSAGAQSTRAITSADYDQWKSISSPTLTNDGRWAVYSLVPEVGEGWLVARSTSGGTEYKFSRGFIGRPTLQTSGRDRYAAPAVAITSDSRWVVFSIEPQRDVFEAARRAMKPAAQQPKSSLGILDLTTGNLTQVVRVRSYKVPKDRGAVVAYAVEADSGAPADSAAHGRDSVDAGKRKEAGTALMLRDLATGDTVRIADVSSYAFADSGTALAYTVSVKNGGDADGVYLRSVAGPIASGETKRVLAGPGRYQGLTFDRSGRQLAFLTDRDEFPKNKARFALYYSTGGDPARIAVRHDGVGTDMVVAANAAGSMQFTKAGDALIFGVGPTPADSVPADSLTEKAVFDLWHYKDQYIQPSQKFSAGALRAPYYTAMYWPGASRWVQLGNDSSWDVRLSEDAKTGLAVSNYPYRISGMWGDERYDLFVVDPASGKWKPFKQGLPGTSGPVPTPGGRANGGGDVAFSPGGKYALLFENKSWSAYDVARGKTVNLTRRLANVRFDNETDDHPAAASPWGVAGWTTGDDRVLVYDRFDVWSIDPTGVAPPKNITGGVGRAKHIVFRVTRVDRDDPYINSNAPVLLKAVDFETKDEGFWNVSLADAKPAKIVMVPKSVGFIAKAKHADQLLLTEQTFRDFPDLWTGASLTSLAKISEANPQQSQFRWGTSSLIHFTNANGVRLKAELIKPDGFDPKKKYPLMVNIYELRSQELNRYENPTPNGSAEVNVTTYVSKGYVVVKPDIIYTTGHPGESALATLVPIVKALIDSGFVDPKRVGLSGHSWGGYQDLYVATRTNVFRAIASGAPVSNMTSAYGGIRWGGGINRSMQYERTQSRIGATPWDNPALYLENSALFHLPNVHTPLMVMANDDDGAVPWYQGIELYIGLRRLGKEVYLFDYNNDNHGIGKRANAVDWDIREQQYFDHFLLGGPIPEWMDKGIPYVKKGRDQATTSAIVP
jgi:dipeptidyl aminopeptidase/acylaminoacyl peptidase